LTQLLHLGDLLAEGLKIGTDVDHLLNELGLPIKTLKIFVELGASICTFQAKDEIIVGKL